jgi:hypothetical protein
MRIVPNLRPPRPKPDNAAGSSTGIRCRQCGQDLRFVRKHVSPSRLGAPLTTQFYECGACDSGYAFNPANGKWKPWIGDGDGS